MLRGKLVDIARFYLSDEDEAEDIVQEAMLKLWLVRDRIDREKNISPMGMTVTRNLHRPPAATQDPSARKPDGA